MLLALSQFAPLFADDRDDPLMRAEVVWGVLGIAGAMLVGAAVIYAVDKWRKRAAAGPTEADTIAELTEFRDMYENGEITETEYAELRRRVADRVKKPPAQKPTDPSRTPGGAVIDLAALSDATPPNPPPPPPAGPTESLPPPSTA
jgi:hypothetical protein